MNFKFVSKYSPSVEQQKVIDSISDGIEKNFKFQTIKGVTGSGKTYTMAKIIERMNRQVLIISHNKTLSAQLYREFKEFFPENRVEYFVSYYDYYQPEAYIPARDIYIEKETLVNDDLEKLRSSAAVSLFERRDTIIVASVSCIYGLGDPEDYKSMSIVLKKGEVLHQNAFAMMMVHMQYNRTDLSILNTYEFKIMGDMIEIKTAYMKETIRVIIEFGIIVDVILIDDSGKKTKASEIKIYPAKLFVTPKERIGSAIKSIADELEIEYKKLIDKDKLMYADRLKARTEYDMDMLRETGYCSGIENYSRHILQKEAGSPPFTLMDVFEDDFLMFIDESHVSIPQIKAMYRGDRSRKENLVEYGFRLPSALDNRPLMYDEFEEKINQCIFVSATPDEFELSLSENIATQIIRPTGLLDPLITVYSNDGMMEKVYEEIKKRIDKNERTLVLTVTKKMSEYLASYLSDLQIKAKYLHSEIDTLERVEILRDLRTGVFDVLVGVNLLREGIDLPEVSLVIILDADKMGFLRSKKSLIQIIGRSARHVSGEVLMFCDRITVQMQEAIDETNERRAIQEAHNIKYDITPQGIKKEIKDIIDQKEKSQKDDVDKMTQGILNSFNLSSKKGFKECIDELTKLMNKFARDDEFEKAIKVRDMIKSLTNKK